MFAFLLAKFSNEVTIFVQHEHFRLVGHHLYLCLHVEVLIDNQLKASLKFLTNLILHHSRPHILHVICLELVALLRVASLVRHHDSSLVIEVLHLELLARILQFLRHAILLISLLLYEFLLVLDQGILYSALIGSLLEYFGCL